MIGSMTRVVAGQIVQQLTQQYVREASKAMARRAVRDIQKQVYTVTGDKKVARRFSRLDQKIQNKFRWNALRDASNHFRNEVRKAWGSAPVKNATNQYRKKIARSQQIKRGGRDSLYIGVSYKNSPKARIANLLEWDTRKTRGKLVTTKTKERESQRMLRIIGESIRVQVLQDPVNAKARREAVRARMR